MVYVFLHCGISKNVATACLCNTNSILLVCCCLHCKGLVPTCCCLSITVTWVMKNELPGHLKINLHGSECKITDSFQHSIIHTNHVRTCQNARMILFFICDSIMESTVPITQLWSAYLNTFISTSFRLNSWIHTLILIHILHTYKYGLQKWILYQTWKK